MKSLPEIFQYFLMHNNSYSQCHNVFFDKFLARIKTITLRSIFNVNLLIAICLVFLSMCGEKQPKQKDLGIINTKDALIKMDKIPLSTFSESVEYIPLETNDSCLIGRNPHFFVDGKHIIVVAFRQILLFERASGKFIREISNYGKGPGEYAHTINYPYEASSNLIKCKGWGDKILELDFRGRLKREIFIPKQILGSSVFEIGPDSFFGYRANMGGRDSLKIVAFDAKRNEKFLIRNTDFYTKESPQTFSLFGQEGEFYKYERSVYFKEIWNDTLFLISDDHLEPRFVFNSGEFSPTYEVRGEQKAFDKLKTLYRIEHIIETNDFLFFSVNHNSARYAGYYNKNNQATRFNNYEPDKDNGFYDDLNNLGFLIPESINSDKELVGHMLPNDMIEYLSSNSVEKLTKPSQLQALKNTDNPIVVVVKLK